MGGFDLTLKNSNGTTNCGRSTFSSNVNGTIVDYIPHHAWFQYYKSTANPTHARPSSVNAVGHTYVPGSRTLDPANHAYDLEDFYASVKAGNLPAVSYIKMPAYQDGHPGNSDPLDEQAGNVELINFLQKQPEWHDTARVPGPQRPFTGLPSRPFGCVCLPIPRPHWPGPLTWSAVGSYEALIGAVYWWSYQPSESS
jgi:hypothetical protein